MTIFDEIAAERHRQVAKGYDAAHDDAHPDREILNAEGWGVIERLCEAYNDERPNYRSELVASAALIVAEIERLDRAERRANPMPETYGEMWDGRTERPPREPADG